MTKYQRGSGYLETIQKKSHALSSDGRGHFLLKDELLHLQRILTRSTTAMIQKQRRFVKSSSIMK